MTKLQLERKWNQLKRTLKKKKYFEIKDFDVLGVTYRVLVVLSKKNVGKTYQMMQLMKQCVKRNKKFVLMRLMDAELKHLEKEWNHDPKVPFFIKGGREIYLKDDGSVISTTNATHVGKCIAFKAISQYGSMQFEGYDLLVFDEFMPQNERDERLIYTPDMVNNFFVFLSNVERDKKDLKMYLFGNFIVSGNMLLQQLQFSYSTGIKYDEQTQLLVVNTEDLYVGIKGQTLTQGFLKFSVRIRNALLANEPLSGLDRIMSLEDFFKMDPLLAIMIEENTVIYINSIKVRLDLDQEVIVYAVHLDQYETNRTIYTNNALFANARDNVTFVEDVHEALTTFIDLMAAKRMFYTKFTAARLLYEFLTKEGKVTVTGR